MSTVQGLFITADEFDALVEDIGRSPDRFNVPARDQDELVAIRQGASRGDLFVGPSPSAFSARASVCRDLK